MSGLPPALAPWAAPLVSLAADLRPVVGEWARRIASALGPPAGLHVDAGEPDGVAGLTRRAPYERLLLSEWLLATELPDEFLRRASAGEHLFLQRSRRERSSGQRVVALLDAGPEQLGSPRLAQLALLVVLSTRASAAGARLEWAVVQGTPGVKFTGFSRDQVTLFLGSRSTDLVDGARAAAWLEHAAGGEGTAPECWLVGGGQLLAHARPGDSTVLIEEDVAPGERRLRLVVAKRRSERRELLLELPGDAQGTRLLRDPFAQATAAPARLPGRAIPEAGVTFHPRSRRLLARAEEGALIDLPVPGSAGARSVPPRKVKAPSGLIAAGWFRRKVQLVRFDGARVRLGDACAVLPRGAGVMPPAVVGGRDPIPAVVVAGGRVDCFFQDCLGRLHHAEIGPPRGFLDAPLWPRGERVTALTWLGGRVAWVRRIDDGSVVLESWERGPGEVFQRRLGLGTGRAFMMARPSEFSVAAEQVPGGLGCVWVVPAVSKRAGTARLLQPPHGTQVVGITQLPGWIRAAPEEARPFPASRPGRALVILERDRRNFTLLWPGGLSPAHRATVDVERASLSPDGRILAYTTRQGGLAAWSLARNEMLLQLLPGEGP
ncbi:MAG TPA: hypothetical protein VFM53_08280 [Anaeromyxobacteraceae bacterium]|nr:hypothetical protein [Anaeromyxobacteraceae bacterium]